MPKIIIIDDELDMLELLEYHLKADGYEIKCFTSSVGVMDELEKMDTNLLLVDRNLLIEDGIDFVSKIRKKGYEVAVIFVSAKGSYNDKVLGFDTGADDYIAKPFDISELKARIKAVLRRTTGLKDELIFNEIHIDLIQSEVRILNKKIALSALEFNLLVYFITNQRRLIDRYELADKVWGDDSVNDKAINIAISRLKRKIGKSEKYLIAIRGQGYKLC